MNKKQKKQIIGRDIDLANGRFRDEEIDCLYDIVSNKNSYNGRTRTFKDSYDGWSSEGKFHRNETTSYKIRAGKRGVSIDESYYCHDDDGATWNENRSHTKARDILNVLKKAF